MRFEHDGRKFYIEFQRDNQQRPGGKPATYRSTTARLTLIDPDGNKKLLSEAVVSCWHKEPRFTLEQGRIQALRKLTENISLELRKPLWQAYQNRKGNGGAKARP